MVGVNVDLSEPTHHLLRIMAVANKETLAQTIERIVIEAAKKDPATKNLLK